MLNLINEREALIKYSKALIWDCIEKIKIEKNKKMYYEIIEGSIKIIIKFEKKNKKDLKGDLKEYLIKKNKKRIERELIEYLYKPEKVEKYLKANPEKHIEDMYNW